jgi:cell division septation protein DedD
MSPDTQDMEILPNITRQSGGAQDAPEQMIPEFDAFFEKLSNIDELTLSGGPTSLPEEGGIVHKTIRLRPDKPVNSSPRSSQKRKMQVMRSDFIQNGGKVSPRQSKSAQPGSRAGVGLPAGIVTFFKLATAAALLFGIGLGSGYLALSLPFKRDEGFAPKTWEQPAAQAIVSGESIVQDDSGAESESYVPAFSEKTKIVRVPVTTETVKKNPVGRQVNSKNEAVASKPGTPAAKQTPVAAQTQGKYAIQVGACNSPACVSAYRKLLLAHVSSDAIQVIERSVGNSQTTVQRIRVVSLNASDANKLKNSLAAADTRFKDAYVITLTKTPSS